MLYKETEEFLYDCFDDEERKVILLQRAAELLNKNIK